MEDSVSGFKVTGSWEEVVEHGERAVAALNRAVAKEEQEDDLEGEPTEKQKESIEEFEEWRPRVEETDRDVSDKTAEKASTAEGEGEKEGASPMEDVKEATENAKEAVNATKELDQESATKNASKSLEQTQRATDTAVRRTVRAVEETIYKRLMTAISPYYFDNTLVSANLTKHSEGKFTLEINISDDELKKKVRHELEELEKISNWHTEAEINTEPIEFVESSEGEELGNVRTKEQVEDINSQKSKNLKEASENETYTEQNDESN